MYHPSNKDPQFGSTDWAARKIRGLLDEEERRGASPARASIQTAQNASSSPPIPPPKPARAPAPDYPPPPVKPDLTPAWRQDERANRIIDGLISREVVPGGRTAWNDPNPHGGPTNYGVTSSGLAEWHRYAGAEKMPDRDAMPDHPYKLSREQAFRILKEGFYDQYKLPQIDDEVLASHLADMYVNHGFPNASKIVQRALDQVMRAHDLYTMRRIPFEAGDPVGNRTRSRLNWIIRSGYGPELRNAIVDQRLAFMRDAGGIRDEDKPELYGRTGQFREWVHPPIGYAGD